MSTRYLEILAQQNPFPIGLDDQGRIMFSCNYYAVSQKSSVYEEDIAAIISNNSLGVSGVDLFIGQTVTVPSGSGPYILIISTGGLSDLETHNSDIYSRPSAQVIVFSDTYATAKSRAFDIYNVLSGAREITA